MKPEDIVALIANINGLYSNLVAYTVGVMLFAGALIPGVISFFLNRQIRIEQESTNKRLLTELENAKRELADSLASKVVGEVEIFEKKLSDRLVEQENTFRKKLANAEGGMFHLQANSSFERNFITNATNDFVIAANRYIQSKDELNLQRVLNRLKECLSKLDKQEFEGDIDLEPKIHDLLAKLKDLNETGRYTDLSKDLTLSLNLATKREPSVD